MSTPSPSDAPETPPPEAALSAPLYSSLAQLPLPALFHLATLGGASLCELEKVVGNFEVGKEFDALLVDLSEGRGNGALWFDEEEGGEESWLEGGFEQWVSVFGRVPFSLSLSREPERTKLTIFSRFQIWTGDDRNIAKVWVQGKMVGGKDL